MWRNREKERGKRDKKGNKKIENRGKRKEKKRGMLENEGVEDLAWLGLIGYRDFRSEKIEWFC